MQEELRAIQRTVGTTFVHVTHDQEAAMAIADRIVVMNNGFIEDMGQPERSVTAASGGRVTVETAIGTFEVKGEAAAGAKVGLSVRPEHLYLEGGEGRVPVGRATMQDGGFFGTHHQCAARMEGLDDPVKVRLPQKQIPRPGEELALYADPADMVLLTR